MLKMKQVVRYFLICLFAWFLIHEIFIIVDGLNDGTDKSEVAVIFGNTVNADGTISDRLKARLDRGLKLYNDSLVKTINVSGGLGIEGYLEGTKMAEYLELKGVLKKDITVDNEGNNSKLTAINFAKSHSSTKSVTLVSQFYHISRAKLAFKKVGIENVKAVHCNYYELRDIYSLIREFPAYYKYLLFF